MASELPFNQLTDDSTGTGGVPEPRRAVDCARCLSCLVLPLACALLALAAGCSAPSEPAKAAATQRRTYTNPVYSDSMPDPSVIRFQGFYYAFGTTGNGRTLDGRIFTTLRSHSRSPGTVSPMGRASNRC